MIKSTIVTLCGSTRFYQEYQQAYFEETMKMNIVLSVGFYAGSPDAMNQLHGEGVGITEDEKIELDLLHLVKIGISHEILVIDPGGYIGESTKKEIKFAQMMGKKIRYWSKEPEYGGNGEDA